jgi:hypothetical protein
LKRSSLAFAFVLCLLLSGCARAPESYPLAVRSPLALPDWAVDPPVADMAAADAGEFIVKDIDSNPAGTWRWTFERPELRFALHCTGGQKFFAEFGVAEATLAQTGPITVSFLVNGRPLGELYCPKAGLFRFEREVPAAWLTTSAYTHVVMLASKVFVAEADGAKLGFSLVRAGFVESCGKPSAF